MADIGCCSIDLPVENDGDCNAATSGIFSVLISCAKQVTLVTETGCPAPVITDIETVDGAGTTGPSFYPIENIIKASGWAFDYVSDPVAGNTTLSETVTIATRVKTPAAMCALRQYIGQYVTLLWQNNGTETWNMTGRGKDLYVTQITGGTGTDASVDTVITMVAADLRKATYPVFITNTATTTALIASVTA